MLETQKSLGWVLAPFAFDVWFDFTCTQVVQYNKPRQKYMMKVEGAKKEVLGKFFLEDYL